ncbi:MAG TPA: HipA domain-containing protein [Burkholderiaceae bacterium]|nr:HipA domain-containing protein [Burkholderiaceae bacterium]
MASSSRPAARLDVYWGAEHVGSVYDTQPLSFAYTSPWLKHTQAHAIAGIALQPGLINSAAVASFFENLLPEGALRDYLAQQKQASTLFWLLHKIVGDSAGGYVLMPGGHRPTPAHYEASSWQALAKALKTSPAIELGLKRRGTRISLAGAQDKLGIALFADGIPRLPQGTAASTHILKPNIQHTARVWHSATNETLIMLTAAHCGLPSAEVFYEPTTQSCVVRRYDRYEKTPGVIERLIQYDFCQLAGLPSHGKYESEGGPGIADCAAIIRHYSAQPAVDLKHFIVWIFFNLFVGNHDSHAKNLSIYQQRDGTVRLSPFYDLMSTRLYPGLSKQFALSVGGQTHPGALSKAHVQRMAQTLGMQPKFALAMASTLSQSLPPALSQAMRTLAPRLSPSARNLAMRLEQFVRSNTKKIAARLSLPNHSAKGDQGQSSPPGKR